MKKVIVTGANGFIGSNLVNKLSNKGIKVFAFVRSKESICNIQENKNVEIIECNFNNYNDFDISLIKGNVDAFYHFAWNGNNGKSRADYTLQLSNVKYTLDAIKLAKRLDCSKFIFPGSIIEYEYKKLKNKLGCDISINNIYGISKITAREMGVVLSKNIGINFIETTISNIYGIGEKNERLVLSTIKKLLNNEETSFTDGNQLYDFIYIDDAVEAFYLVGLLGESNKNYYIGNVKQKKLKDYIKIIGKCINPDAILGLGKLGCSSVSLDYSEINTSVLYDDFNFIPKVSFEEGIIKTKKWVEER